MRCHAFACAAINPYIAKATQPLLASEGQRKCEKWSLETRTCAHGVWRGNSSICSDHVSHVRSGIWKSRQGAIGCPFDKCVTLLTTLFWLFLVWCQDLDKEGLGLIHWQKTGPRVSSIRSLHLEPVFCRLGQAWQPTALIGFSGFEWWSNCILAIETGLDKFPKQLATGVRTQRNCTVTVQDSPADVVAQILVVPAKSNQTGVCRECLYICRGSFKNQPMTVMVSSMRNHPALQDKLLGFNSAQSPSTEYHWISSVSIWLVANLSVFLNLPSFPFLSFPSILKVWGLAQGARGDDGETSKVPAPSRTMWPDSLYKETGRWLLWHLRGVTDWPTTFVWVA